MSKILSLFNVIVSALGVGVFGFNFIRGFIHENGIAIVAFAILTALMVALTKVSYHEFKTTE